MASRLYEILRKDVFSDIETGPRTQLADPIAPTDTHLSPHTYGNWIQFQTLQTHTLLTPQLYLSHLQAQMNLKPESQGESRYTYPWTGECSSHGHKPQTEQTGEDLQEPDDGQGNQTKFVVVIYAIDEHPTVAPDGVQDDERGDVAMEQQRAYIVRSDAFYFTIQLPVPAGGCHVGECDTGNAKKKWTAWSLFAKRSKLKFYSCGILNNKIT